MRVWVIVKIDDVANEIYVHEDSESACKALREIVSDLCDDEPEDQPTENENIDDLLQRFGLLGSKTILLCEERPLHRKEDD